MKLRYRSISAIAVAVALSSFAGRMALSPPSAGAQQAGTSGYHLAKRVALGGEGDWDYLEVDPNTHRVFITRGTHVMVIDPEQGKVIGDVPKTPFVHGIAIAADLHRGFTTNGDTSSVTIFDTNTLEKIAEPITGKEPDAILYDPSTKRAFAMNRTGTSTVIDATSGKVVGTVSLGGQPEFGVADGKGRVFVDLENKNALAEVDAKTMKLLNTWPLAPCAEPSGLAIDAVHERLFVGCHNKVMAFVDGDSGKVLGTIPIGDGVDADRFDSATGFAFASCGDGTLTVAHEDSPDKLTLVEHIKTELGARTMALDYATHTVYSVTALFGPRPAPAPDHPRRRPTMVPGSFTLLVYRR